MWLCAGHCRRACQFADGGLAVKPPAGLQHGGTTGPQGCTDARLQVSGRRCDAMRCDAMSDGGGDAE